MISIGLDTWVSAIYFGDLDCQVCFQNDSVSAVKDVWGVNQWMACPCPSLILSICFSNKSEEWKRSSRRYHSGSKRLWVQLSAVSQGYGVRSWGRQANCSMKAPEKYTWANLFYAFCFQRFEGPKWIVCLSLQLFFCNRNSKWI